eukprot:gene1530-biopygen1392
MDVETAFLNSGLDEELYVRLPSGLEHEGRRIARLWKAVYGSKQAGKEWFDNSDAFILGYDSRMSKSSMEPCLYYIMEGDLIVLLLCYVDDYVVVRNSEDSYLNNLVRLQPQNERSSTLPAKREKLADLSFQELLTMSVDCVQILEG